MFAIFVSIFKIVFFVNSSKTERHFSISLDKPIVFQVSYCMIVQRSGVVAEVFPLEGAEVLIGVF